MTGTICSVANCKSNHAKAKKDGEIIRFFTFPRSPLTRKQWVRLCHRKNNFNPLNKRICSKHFDSNQFEDLIHAKLTNSVCSKLKKTALPTLFLPNKTEKVNSERNKRYEVRQRKEIVSIF
ncbi:hypothetical protein ABEB36_004652 [Hypothenemus hampei]|uniref:THAP-type domain-containing protein n=1 Tax=Hypothenemus hampei TaxID=57062 RepID=A0ABD1F4N6_HYPHA